MSIASPVERKLKRDGRSALPEIKDLSLAAGNDAEAAMTKKDRKNRRSQAMAEESEAAF
jgi:hypothetical protein